MRRDFSTTSPRCSHETQVSRFRTHVKNLDRSSAASHLIAQTLVSTDALRFDEEAREAVRQKIRAAGGPPDLLSGGPQRVLLAIASERSIGPSDLFTFNKVTLARLDSALAAAGVQIFVAPIRRARP